MLTEFVGISSGAAFGAGAGVVPSREEVGRDPQEEKLRVPVPTRARKDAEYVWYSPHHTFEELRSADETQVFDNYRVLHGRSAFTGLRRICGAYSTFPSRSLRFGAAVLTWRLSLQSIGTTSCLGGEIQTCLGRRC